jgi:hypothetical protein
LSAGQSFRKSFNDFFKSAQDFSCIYFRISGAYIDPVDIKIVVDYIDCYCSGVIVMELARIVLAKSDFSVVFTFTIPGLIGIPGCNTL